MSSASESTARPVGQPVGLQLRQTWSVLTLEIRKSFWGRRALVVYLLALAPVGLMAMGAVGSVVEARVQGRPEPLTDEVFAAIYQMFILRWCIFFGCAAIFMNLFRGEVMDRSLHHYFLVPLRRELIVVGKYGAGLFAAVVLFGWATAVSMLLAYVPLALEAGVGQAVAAVRIDYMVAYVAATCLACMGYGALFLVIGILFRNPIIPALVVLAWESIIFLLPPGLKHISVVHYLESLIPVPMSEGPFAIVADPAPLPLAILGLTVFSAVLLAVAGRRVRSMEISYPA